MVSLEVLDPQGIANATRRHQAQKERREVRAVRAPNGKGHLDRSQQVTPPPQLCVNHQRIEQHCRYQWPYGRLRERVRKERQVCEAPQDPHDQQGSK
jgi:hypothetical protein